MSISGHEYLDAIKTSTEYREASKALRNVASMINSIAIPRETPIQSYHDAWHDIFRFHLRCGRE